MTNHPALAAIQKQIKELDDIVKQTAGDLNTVRGSERLASWKKRTVPLLAEHVGQQEVQQLAAATPGPSFTNDLLEEFSDEADVYRNVLVALAKRIQQPS